MFSCISRPSVYSRLDAKNSYSLPDLLVSRNFISVAVSCYYGQWYPILGQNSLIYIPCPRLNPSKTLLFTAAHTYTLPYIWEYSATFPSMKAYNKFLACKTDSWLQNRLFLCWAREFRGPARASRIEHGLSFYWPVLPFTGRKLYCICQFSTRNYIRFFLKFQSWQLFIKSS